ncbi:acetyl esterase/lipase [Nitrobacteraceae bacterium AZCC 2146]
MVLSKSALVAATFSIVAAQAAWAQQSPMPEEITAKLQELGRVIDPPKTGQLYALLQEKEPYQGVKVERDIKYGAADRNLLDVFAPEAASSPRPVLIYVHGGGFARGDKRAPGSPFNDNIMLWAVRNGYIGVDATYRLAPQAVWPGGAEDLAAAVQWVADNVGARGGDRARIYLMGHSSGAVHVADYVSRPELHKVKGGGLAGAILVSGIYDMPATAVNDYRVYFGADPARHAEQSSLPGLLTTKIPLMMVAAELDPPGFVQQFELLKQASCKRASGCSRAVMLPQHSHMSEVYSINTADTRLTGEVIDFMNTGK